MNTINLLIECPACKATGIYSGMGEGEGTAVVCCKCDGTGAYEYKYSYELFSGRKEAKNVERVYVSGYGYKIGLGEVIFSDVKLNMDDEGVSYSEFLGGSNPQHIRSLACPLLADQGACHEIKGFNEECHRLAGGWVGKITKCSNQQNKAECWKRFYGEKDSA